MTIGLGLVGLDRFIINPLFPVMQKELGLNYQDEGLLSVVLALAWGVASAFSGPLGGPLWRCAEQHSRRQASPRWKAAHGSPE
jgi:hypothetical protein